MGSKPPICEASLVDAALAAGVSGFVYTSFSGTIGFDDSLFTAKRAVEQHLQRSGLTYTISRPSYFMEVRLSPMLGFDYPNAKATIYGSGENEIGWISLADVARFAVENLDNPAAGNAIIELGGPEALSPPAVVQTFEEVRGQPLRWSTCPRKPSNSRPSPQPIAAGLLRGSDAFVCQGRYRRLASDA